MEAAAEGCGNGVQRRDKVKDSRALFQPLPLGEPYIEGELHHVQTDFMDRHSLLQ